MSALVPRIAVVALLVLSVYALALLLDGDPFGDPPDSFRTFRYEGVELRYPPSWRMTGTRVIRFGPPDSAGKARPLAELRQFRATRGAQRRATHTADRLVLGDRNEVSPYDIEVPGSETSSAIDVVFKLRNGRQHRLTTVTATDAGRVVSLAVRGPVSDGPADPRVMAGSLRLDR